MQTSLPPNRSTVLAHHQTSQLGNCNGVNPVGFWGRLEYQGCILFQKHPHGAAPSLLMKCLHSSLALYKELKQLRPLGRMWSDLTNASWEFEFPTPNLNLTAITQQSGHLARSLAGVKSRKERAKEDWVTPVKVEVCLHNINRQKKTLEVLHTC